MRIEIERKFLVVGDGWKQHADSGMLCRQGYLVSDRRKTVRVRRLGESGWLTVKGASEGIARMELEYEIDAADAACMLQLCDQVIEKTRHHIRVCGMLWEVDVFAGANAGLIIAEVELESEDQDIDLPDWVGEEVSDDPRYYNACLARHPFTTWQP